MKITGLFVCLFGRVHVVNESSYETKPISPEIRRFPTDLFPHDVGFHRIFWPHEGLLGFRRRSTSKDEWHCLEENLADFLMTAPEQRFKGRQSLKDEGES